MEETWFYEILFSKWYPSWQKKKKMHYKSYNANQNYFYALQELLYVKKSKVTSSFWGILYGLCLLAGFFFSLLLSIG